MLRWLKFSVVALVGCGFLGMIGYALWMRDAIRSAQLEPPLISEPDTPVKRRPETPGGMEIPNRDKLVFDLLDNSASATAPEPAALDGSTGEATFADNSGAAPSRTDTTRAALPKAVTPVAVAEKETTQATVTDQLALARLASGDDAAPVSSQQSASQQVSPAAGPAKATPMVTPTVKVAAIIPTAKPVAKPVTQAAAGASATTTVATTGAASGWGIQVGAVNTLADANRLAVALQSKFATLKPLTLHTQSVTAGKTNHIRVQFYGLSDRAAATKACSQLGSKQACFPVGG